jgi:putative oxidoreductase
MLPAKLKCCLQACKVPSCESGALLVLRLIVGIAFLYHGWGKITHPFGWMPPEAPVPGFLQFLAAVSEFGGGVALILGLLTRVFMVGLSITMLVAVYMHAVMMKDPFVASGAGQTSYELALVYLGIAILFMVVGPGKFSVDAKVFGEACEKV